MQLIKRIARTLFGIYAIIVFAIIMILAVIGYIIFFTFLNEKKAPFVVHKWISRPWAGSLFVFFGIRLIVNNKKLLDPSQTYVFIGNHRSLLDIPAYAIATNHVIRFLAKSELLKVPLLGWVIGKLYISVNRKDKAARAKSMERMMDSLKEGISVFICPEGTRNKTDQPLLPFHDGAFRLAIQSQVPLAILVVQNSEKLLSPTDPIALRPGTIVSYWCKPIPTTGMTQDDLPELKLSATKAMLEYL
jgi:1-acyl-sn-glycerol-3-phosphate acyltransferase